MPKTKKLSNKDENGFEKPVVSKKEKLVKILEDIDGIGDVIGSAVISTDGLCIASNIKEGIDIDTFAAMSAAMQGAAETAVSELKQGNLRQIIIDADNGKIITISAGKKSIIVILANPKINLGLALLELGKASGRISSILGE